MSKILEIVKHPHPVLTKICTPVTVFNQALKDLAANMLYTIDRNEENTRRIGVGLAAPQVNAPICMVVIAATGYPEMALCNPVIERGKGSKLGNEGCLSLPDKHADVARYTDIWVNYQDLNGKACRMKARDFIARVFQHEIDHLSGIEFTDRVGKEPKEEVLLAAA
jgi:peptide deformylase